MDWYNKGVALDDQGNYYAAFGAYSEATRIDPNLAEAWYKQGIYLYNVSDKFDTYDQAMECFTKALELDPGLLSMAV
jgi:tetratricopeptide (TPR) repeat protein